ncbi:MAG: hypothetical protein GY850_18985 [bacterium]|nr:hypothetical protein [bacterium]
MNGVKRDIPVRLPYYNPFRMKVKNWIFAVKYFSNLVCRWPAKNARLVKAAIAAK